MVALEFLNLTAEIIRLFIMRLRRDDEIRRLVFLRARDCIVSSRPPAP
jgi:hypothetical protein